jgi:hypothetical protein
MSRSILLDNDGNPVYNAGFSLKKLIDSMPVGLEREVLRILDFHRGHKNVISRKKLINDLRSLGFHIDDRKVRACINQLRKSEKPGSWICSTGGENGGYWMAESQEELEQYIQREQESRLKDLAKQAKAMRIAAEKYWGMYSPEKQISLF